MNFSSVVSYHTNTYGCGVARFGSELAKRLGVPFIDLCGKWGEHALLSLKWSEIENTDAVFTNLPIWSQYSVFWHDKGNELVTDTAQHVFYADPSLGSPGLWCPSLIPPRKTPIRLFSFGMAHKLQTARYQRVRELLDAAKQPYHLRVSVGLHEGTSLDGAEKHFDALKDIMGADHVTILGILSDDAVSEELHAADYVLAFFESGVRGNNTTVNAAIDHGCRVITNKDSLSPAPFYHNNAMCVCCLREWPQPERTYFSWENLLMRMEGVCEASQSATA